jgi:hypothetical protein
MQSKAMSQGSAIGQIERLKAYAEHLKKRCVTGVGLKNRRASKASSCPRVTVENGEKHKAQGDRFVANLGKPSKSLEHKKHAHKASVSFPADPNTQW